MNPLVLWSFVFWCGLDPTMKIVVPVAVVFYGLCIEKISCLVLAFICLPFVGLKNKYKKEEILYIGRYLP